MGRGTLLGPGAGSSALVSAGPCHTLKVASLVHLMLQMGILRLRNVDRFAQGHPASSPLPKPLPEASSGSIRLKLSNRWQEEEGDASPEECPSDGVFSGFHGRWQRMGVYLTPSPALASLPRCIRPPWFVSCLSRSLALAGHPLVKAGRQGPSYLDTEQLGDRWPTLSCPVAGRPHLVGGSCGEAPCRALPQAQPTASAPPSSPPGTRLEPARRPDRQYGVLPHPPHFPWENKAACTQGVLPRGDERVGWPRDALLTADRGGGTAPGEGGPRSSCCVWQPGPRGDPGRS